MRIATFNANSIRARMDVILRWMDENRPDVLCIQETKVVDEDFPRQPLEDKGYNVVFHGEKAYNGVAIVSVDRPSAVRFGLDDGEPADATRLAYARFGPVHLVNSYVPQGREITHAMYAYKLRWFKRLRAYFDRHFSTRMKVVWLGDMNVAPTPEDVHNPEKQKSHVCFHADAREAYENALAWGFKDVFRKHHPGPGHYSFFDYRMRGALKENMGWRIDHVLATPPLARLCTDAHIDVAPRKREKCSDHTFVVADFAV